MTKLESKFVICMSYACHCVRIIKTAPLVEVFKPLPPLYNSNTSKWEAAFPFTGKLTLTTFLTHSEGKHKIPRNTLSSKNQSTCSGNSRAWSCAVHTQCSVENVAKTSLNLTKLQLIRWTGLFVCFPG